MIDPLSTTALLSLDLGSVYSADGRETPVTAFTPVVTAAQAIASTPVGNPSSGAAGTSGGAPVTQASLSLPGLPSLPANLGSRLAVGTLAVLLIALAVWRLLKD